MKLVFSKNGLVERGQIHSRQISPNEGIISFDVRTGTTGYGISIYPIGITIKWVDSDLSKK